VSDDVFEDGTASLSAAYDLAGGSVIAQHYRRHRHQEFLRFLKLTGAAVPRDLDLHLVLDNYATCKTPDPPASPSPAHPHHRQPRTACSRNPASAPQWPRPRAVNAVTGLIVTG
jgi:hypothetical protein